MAIVRNVAVAAMLTAVYVGAANAGASANLNAEMRSFYDILLTEAKKADPSVKSFSAEEGHKFFLAKHVNKENGEERSCSKCHTSDPKQKGQTPVGKSIEPMAMSVNKDRFTERAKVEKWFKRNCQWVLGRQCTAKEKGDYIAYMSSL